jgi:hypothetical protein
MNSSPRRVQVPIDAKKPLWTVPGSWRLWPLNPYANAKSGEGYFVYAIENQSQLIRYNCAGMPAAEIFEVKLFEKEGRCKKERVPVPVELFFSELKAKIIAMRKSESKDITKEVEYVRQKKKTYV